MILETRKKVNMKNKSDVIDGILMLLLTFCMLVNIFQTAYYAHEGTLLQPDRLIEDTVITGVCLIVTWANIINKKLDKILENQEQRKLR